MARMLTVLGSLGLLLALAAAPAGAQRTDVLLATTTSTQDTGLLDLLVPRFEARSGFQVKTVAVGTGEALAMGRRGEADVLLVHAPEAEERFMAEGHGARRLAVMHNDFVLVGPPEDPARIRGLTPAAAFKAIGEAGAAFVSRGDQSGTHKKEEALWRQAGLTPRGRWHLESGTGMGETLLIAYSKRGYTLTDRGTYLALRRRMDLEVLLEGDSTLRNPYHVIEVNSARHPKVHAEGARRFAEFLVGPDIQRLIATFGLTRYGRPLFFPDALPGSR